ncbi:MAG: magnesium chelatase [Candidatus Tectomicrobia bacterium]|uniref:Magnesium chelatase n=1 Tax=Tectimicrobiota bacterium TaxID=2528274 RepID=A0A937W6Y5_UNCTE|nr:magnesium chelatase [Candidatus Tectomicrobia bacterium]
MTQPKTFGELKRSGYKPLSVKAELRKNLIRKMLDREPLFPGIFGFEDTVIPQVQNALLAGQDMIFLGERGQAKTRLIRSLTSLLDPELPYVEGSEINDDPFAPISRYAQDMLAKHGDETPIAWLAREERYGEKLATPDVTTPELIGEVDPIKVAEGRYLSDELVIHYGLIPRSNRGLFCINELPDLSEKLQVGLFNIMQERDVQIRGFRVRLQLDMCVVASANPEDYTNRGRIITPLKDRYGAQIRTHYPKQIDIEIDIMDAERSPLLSSDGYSIVVPRFMKEIIAETTSMAREHADINQRSGVSVRMSIANYESMISNALRRTILLREDEVVPRISDLGSLIPSSSGKIELETVEEGKEGQIIDELIKKAIKKVFGNHFRLDDFSSFLHNFTTGRSLEVSDTMPTALYTQKAREMGGLHEAVQRLDMLESPGLRASALEFILEGLHLNKKLNKKVLEGEISYWG